MTTKRQAKDSVATGVNRVFFDDMSSANWKSTRTDIEDFDPSKPTISGIDTLIIGCGNLLRGDDATGPVLIRRMWEEGCPKECIVPMVAQAEWMSRFRCEAYRT